MNALQGKIINAPLVIEDENSHALIKNATIYIYSTFESDTLSITSLIPEGTFQLKLNSKDSIIKHRKVKDSFTDEQWLSTVKELFSGTYDNNDLELTGKYLTSSDNYVDGELVEDGDEENEDFERNRHKYLSIDIKTSNKKLTITVGTFQVPLMKVIGGEDETNLLNWLDLLISGHRGNIRIIKDLTKENTKLLNERDYYKKEVIKSATEHLEIMNDIESKFYRVLNAKKDKIWELEQKMKGNDANFALVGLNEKYIEENKFNLNTDIDIKEIPSKLRDELIKKRKVRKVADGKKGGGARKRKKTAGSVLKEEEEGENDEEAEDEPEESEYEYENENLEQVIEPEIKVEEVDTDEEDERILEDEDQDKEMKLSPKDADKSDSIEIKEEDEPLSVNELERIQKEKQKNKFKLRRFTNKYERQAKERKIADEEERAQEQVEEEDEEEEHSNDDDDGERVGPEQYGSIHRSTKTLSDRDIVEDSVSISPPNQDKTDIDTDVENSNDSGNVDISDFDLDGFEGHKDKDNANEESTTQSAISDSLKS
ncbi:hypothetical protein CLIB1423_03S03246 [[Candida] railenensis]|uniref:Uncharacterized protein n=1 Tax=[Candida] railenensis TaxID=45579 RepID=A0A9P0VX99_9ASCO|nr:hypothetical protein CLIB1423_03S03246 [[Candida] railenensis]